eukprot:CAMPEP_0184860968 /NCGR_PEP_ID=MMETSP0580-20130426/5748_1 /TAXON_ID=1118495 /ORGANISM="Dactyliosolen fragilissimus" /LENGTH=345 /DNA_ID=CAMNT_0027358269 /DNA_START=41 /DNA_END=1078 /DNA_ORIENTATION=+
MSFLSLTAFAAILRIVFITKLPHAIRADNEIAVIRALHAAYPDWKPRGIVDVGANQGNWTRAVQHSRMYKGVPTFMIEASPQHTKTLEQVKRQFEPHVNYQIEVLSGKDNDQVEFYGFGGTGDSMFKENTKFYKDEKPIIRNTTKLDTILKNEMEYVDILKLDVQGAELRVLSGASDTLKRATFVQMEVSIVEYNQGGACWFELDALLREHGFYLYDLGDFSKNIQLFHSKGIGQFDVLYIKPTSPYLPKWIKDKESLFCGAGREKDVEKDKLKDGEVKPVTSDESMFSASLRIDKNGAIVDQPVVVLSLSLLLGFFITFLTGLIAGTKLSTWRATKKQQRMKKS